MVVTSLGGVAGFSVGLGVKNSYGAWGSIQIAGVGLGLFKISWGKNLKGTVILVGLLFCWFCFQVVVYGCVVWTRNLALIPKLM